MADVIDPVPLVRVVELYGTSGCPYTRELREHLLWKGVDFTEYDVEADAAARQRLAALVARTGSPGARAVVPVLVERGRVLEIGWRGRSCAVDTA
jgi:mycoredoxin